MSEQTARGQRRPDMLTAGQLSYAGGVNAADRNHREVRPDQLAMAVNATMRDGWCCTRPDFRAIQPVFFTERLEHLVRWGHAQGGVFYPADSGSYVVFVMSGEILGIDPPTGHVFSLTGRKVFSGRAPFCYFEIKDGKCIVQDGTSTPRVIEGRQARIARLDLGEVPVGKVMADGWYRLALGSRGGRSIRFSDHESDPTSMPLYFREEDDLYLFSGRQFDMTSRGGKLVALAYSPFLDSDTGTGPLIAFKQYETVAYDVSVPRSQWTQADIARTILPQIGACSHRAIVARDDDLVFSDHRGRIRSLSSARRDATHPHVVALDRSVYPLYETENAHLRQYRSAVAFDDRILVTVLPRSCPVQGPAGYRNVAHDAIVVLENDVSLGYEQSNVPVWAGIWTGIAPMWMVSGQFGQGDSESGEEICVAMSLDADGQNRFYRIMTESTGRDHAPVKSTNDLRQKPVEMIAVSRWMDFDAPMIQKDLAGAAVRLSGMSGDVQVHAGYRADGREAELPWDRLDLCAGGRLDVPTLREAADQSLSPWNLRAMPDGNQGPRGESLKRWKQIQLVIRARGRVCLEDFAVMATPETGERRPPLVDDRTCPTDYSRPLNLFTYRAVEEPPSSEPAQSEGCAAEAGAC